MLKNRAANHLMWFEYSRITSEEVQQKFQIGDVLISINGNSIRSIDDIGSTLSSVAPGDVLHFQVSRKHHEKELDKEVCATKIQSIVRGKEARKTVAELREKQKELDKEVCSTKIQSIVTRKTVAELREKQAEGENRSPKRFESIKAQGELGVATGISNGVAEDQKSSKQVLEVVVPEGVYQGQQFQVIANNTELMVICPPNTLPGQKVRIEVDLPSESNNSTHQPLPNQGPGTSKQTISAVIPEGVYPGQLFTVFENGAQLMVTCPPNTVPGQTVMIEVVLPENSSTPIPNQQAPDDSTFEVVIPDGVFPGQSFQVFAGGQQLTVECPMNAQPNQVLRIQVPGATQSSSANTISPPLSQWQEISNPNPAQVKAGCCQVS